MVTPHVSVCALGEGARTPPAPKWDTPRLGVWCAWNQDRGAVKAISRDQPGFCDVKITIVLLGLELPPLSSNCCHQVAQDSIDITHACRTQMLVLIARNINQVGVVEGVT